MFKETDVRQALERFFNLYDANDYEAYDEEECSELGGICISEVAQTIRDNMQDVFEYRVDTNLERGFNYRGKSLFGQRACCIISDMDSGVADIATAAYMTELWLLEDMTFANVHCVDMSYQCGDDYYKTEYRYLIEPVEFPEDLRFSPEEILEELEKMCIPHWEGEATIYEL